jgi:hypothetical protein
MKISILDEPTKLTVHTNEGHPGLLETLQINNNKQLLPLLTEEAMGNTDRASSSHDRLSYLFSA